MPYNFPGPLLLEMSLLYCSVVTYFEILKFETDLFKKIKSGVVFLVSNKTNVCLTVEVLFLAIDADVTNTIVQTGNVTLDNVSPHAS